MDNREVAEVYAELIESVFKHDSEKTYVIADGVFLYDSSKKKLMAYLLQKKNVLKMNAIRARAENIREMYDSLNGKRVVVLLKRDKYNNLSISIVYPFDKYSRLLFAFFNTVALGKNSSEIVKRIRTFIKSFQAVNKPKLRVYEGPQYEE